MFIFNGIILPALREFSMFIHKTFELAAPEQFYRQLNLLTTLALQNVPAPHIVNILRHLTMFKMVLEPLAVVFKALIFESIAEAETLVLRLEMICIGWRDSSYEKFTVPTFVAMIVSRSLFNIPNRVSPLQVVNLGRRYLTTRVSTKTR